MSGRMDKAGSAREDVAEQGSGVAPMGTERARGEDTLSVIERYRIEQRMDTETIPVRDNHERRLIARCDSIEDARLVVAALNTHAGAVEALRKIDALLDEDITAGAFRLRCESLVPDALGPLGGRR